MMSIICAAGNCPTDSPNSAPMRRGDGSGMGGAGAFVTIACYGCPSHGWRDSVVAHVGCAQRIAPALLDVEFWQYESNLSQTNDSRTTVSTRDIQGLYCCRDAACLRHVLNRQGSADAKRILKLAQQDASQARQALAALNLDYEARQQLETVLPTAAASSKPELPQGSASAKVAPRRARGPARVRWYTPLVGTLVGALAGGCLILGVNNSYNVLYRWMTLMLVPAIVVAVAAKIRGWPGGTGPSGCLGSLFRAFLTTGAITVIVFLAPGFMVSGGWAGWLLAGAVVWTLLAWLWPRR